MSEIKIGNVYKRIDNPVYHKEFIVHMVGAFDEDQLKKMYEFCCDLVYKGVLDD